MNTKPDPLPRRVFAVSHHPLPAHPEVSEILRASHDKAAHCVLLAIRPVALAGLLGLLCLTGCSRSENPAASGPATAEPNDANTPGTKPEIAAVDNSLKSGAYDDAAAQLLALVNSGRQFSQQDAAEYRRALNEAYEKAFEAAEKGDTRAQAALKMLRAAAPR